MKVDLFEVLKVISYEKLYLRKQMKSLRHNTYAYYTYMTAEAKYVSLCSTQIFLINKFKKDI